MKIGEEAERLPPGRKSQMMLRPDAKRMDSMAYELTRSFHDFINTFRTANTKPTGSGPPKNCHKTGRSFV